MPCWQQIERTCGSASPFWATPAVGPASLRLCRWSTVKRRWPGTKRNSKTMSQPAKRGPIMPLEIEGRNREGQPGPGPVRERSVKLPKAVRNQIARVMDPKHPNPTDSFQAVGKEVAQQLEAIRALAEPDRGPARAERLLLRHAVAFRSAFGANRLPIRVISQLLGHNVATHVRHYGMWTEPKPPAKRRNGSTRW